MIEQPAATRNASTLDDLTHRQKQVAACLALGQTVKEAALELHVNPKTIEYHWNSLKKKLGVDNYQLLTHWALSRGLIRNVFGLLAACLPVLAWPADPPPLPAAPAPTTTSVTLAWDKSPSPEVTRYRVYWGPSKGKYTNYLETPQLTATIGGLKLPQYFAATAVSSNGLESEFSKEVGGQPCIVVWALSATNATGPWLRWSNITETVVTNASNPMFLRLAITNEWR